MGEEGNKAENVVALGKRKCPVCGKLARHAYRPFCSKRCADVDLGRWLNEDYRIPAVEEAEIGDDEFPDE